MASYPPPTENLPIFNSQSFAAPTTSGGGGGSSITIPFLDANYLQFPLAQTALETIPNLAVSVSGTAPTKIATTNTTDIATTAFVYNNLNGLIPQEPTGGDPTFYTTSQTIEIDPLLYWGCSIYILGSGGNAGASAVDSHNKVYLGGSGQGGDLVEITNVIFDLTSAGFGVPYTQIILHIGGVGELCDVVLSDGITSGTVARTLIPQSGQNATTTTGGAGAVAGPAPTDLNYPGANIIYNLGGNGNTGGAHITDPAPNPVTFPSGGIPFAQYLNCGVGSTNPDETLFGVNYPATGGGGAIAIKLFSYTNGSLFLPKLNPSLFGLASCPTAQSNSNGSQIANTQFVNNFFTEKGGPFASLASPNFSGTPTAPTILSPQDNTASIATTEFVQSTLFNTTLPPLSVYLTANLETYTADLALYDRCDIIFWGAGGEAGASYTPTDGSPWNLGASGGAGGYCRLNNLMFVAGEFDTILFNKNDERVLTQYEEIVSETLFICYNGRVGGDATSTAVGVKNDPRVPSGDLGNSKFLAGSTFITHNALSGADGVVVTDGSQLPAAIPLGGIPYLPPPPVPNGTGLNGYGQNNKDLTGLCGTTVVDFGTDPAFNSDITSIVQIILYPKPDFLSPIYAPIASPNFTGIPTAPTAASGTSTTQIATTEFITQMNLNPNIPLVQAPIYYSLNPVNIEIDPTWVQYDLEVWGQGGQSGNSFAPNAATWNIGGAGGGGAYTKVLGVKLIDYPSTQIVVQYQTSPVKLLILLVNGVQIVICETGGTGFFGTPALPGTGGTGGIADDTSSYFPFANFTFANGTAGENGSQFIEGLDPAVVMPIAGSPSISPPENVTPSIPYETGYGTGSSNQLINANWGTTPEDFPYVPYGNWLIKLTPYIASNLYALNDSPTMTGTPRCLTMVTTDDSTAIATTEFVKNNIWNYTQNGTFILNAPSDNNWSFPQGAGAISLFINDSLIQTNGPQLHFLAAGVYNLKFKFIFSTSTGGDDTITNRIAFLKGPAAITDPLILTIPTYYEFTTSLTAEGESYVPNANTLISGVSLIINGLNPTDPAAATPNVLSSVYAVNSVGGSYTPNFCYLSTTIAITPTDIMEGTNYILPVCNCSGGKTSVCVVYFSINTQSQF